MIYFAIAIITFAILPAIEFVGTKREEKKDFVLDKIKFDGKKSNYKIVLGENAGNFYLNVKKEVFEQASMARRLIYSSRRGKASGWEWFKKFEKWI